MREASKGFSVQEMGRNPKRQKKKMQNFLQEETKEEIADTKKRKLNRILEVIYCEVMLC